MVSPKPSAQVQALFEQIVALPHADRLKLCAEVMTQRPEMLYTIVYPILERTVNELGAARLLTGGRHG